MGVTEGPSMPKERLRRAAYEFCEAFVTGVPPQTVLDRFFTRDAQILEHGPAWATTKLPFLGRTFQGRREEDPKGPHSRGTACDDYYDLLTKTLSFQPLPDTLPPPEAFMVDAIQGKVTVKMHARFASVETGRDWEERFIYVLSDFDERGRIGRQELWADPLSAWMAVHA